VNTYRNRDTGELSRELEIRQHFNGMLPAVFNSETCDMLGIDPVLSSPQPEADAQHSVRLDGVKQDTSGHWVWAWSIHEREAEELAELAASGRREAELSLIASLEDLYDRKAQEKRYDNRLTCALRAGYIGPFHAEGQAFALWMDQCNAIAYQLLQQAKTGILPLPTVDDMLGQLPELAWPD
jgi:hypothetical protein